MIRRDSQTDRPQRARLTPGRALRWLLLVPFLMLATISQGTMIEAAPAGGVRIVLCTGTGMVDAMATWITDVLPPALGPFLAPITGLLSIPFTFFMSNDAFYFGILPILAESAATYGIEPIEMARASITGQPVHLQSPLVPAILLLVSLANVNLGDHHKKVLWRACVVSLVMLLVGVLVGVIPFG